MKGKKVTANVRRNKTISEQIEKEQKNGGQAVG